MGKSIRSKIKKHFRTAKRQRVDAMIVTPREKEHAESLRRVMEGRSVTFLEPKNAFKYPTHETAVFPQHEIVKPIDFRSENLPMAGYVFRGNRRKYTGEQAEYMASLSKIHPEMEVLAGGGAILAKTGVRVSKRQAEILATAERNPEAVAAAVAMPASGADAVAAAAAEASAAATSSSAVAPSGAGSAADVEMAPASAEAPSIVNAGDAAAGPAAIPAADVAAGPAADVVECEVEPMNEADHTRVPVLKDSRRAKRAAEHRPRSNAVKKKTKQLPRIEAAPSAAKAKASEVAAPAPKSVAAPSSAAPASAPSVATAASEAVATTPKEGAAQKSAGGKKKNNKKKGAAGAE